MSPTSRKSNSTTTMWKLLGFLLVWGLSTQGCGSEPTVEPEPYADRVTEFEPGEGAGFGQDKLPDIVLGAPHGGGAYSGSSDVLSLGKGGTIVLEFVDMWPVDGAGVDLLVFENPFMIAGLEPEAGLFAEPARVSLSEDGVTWYEFACEAEAYPYVGCAGVNPVYANESEGISAVDPEVAGGDGFDLADLGLKSARFVRIEDAGLSATGDGGTVGFDLDAISVVNGEWLE